MGIRKLLHDMVSVSRNTDLAETAECLNTLNKNKELIAKQARDTGREALYKEYTSLLEELTIIASSAILGENRPTYKEMKQIARGT